MNKFDKEELNQAYEEITQAWLGALLQLMAHDKKYKEVNFFKTTIRTEEGGTYLLSLQHVDGHKIVFTEKEEQV